MARIKVPSFAKEAAKKALKERMNFKEPPGLNPKEAKQKNIRSGVNTARRLLDGKTISEERAKAIGRFYDRFKNKRTKRSEVALGLWGGRRFGKQMAKKY